MKRMVALSLVLLLSIDSFAAVVSDNDGSAFITKAEFDSLKNNFQSQIDQYNSSIDSKIDGAIASYLAGIQFQTEEKFKCNNDLLLFPLVYEKQNAKVERIVNTGNVYGEALIKFGMDLWLMSERGDAGARHYRKPVTGEATTGYVGYISGSDCIIDGTYDINRCDLAGATFVSYDRAAGGTQTANVLCGGLLFDYVKDTESSRTTWNTATYDQTRIYGSSSTHAWRLNPDGKEILTVRKDSSDWYGSYLPFNYWSNMENYTYNHTQVMDRLNKVNPTYTGNINFLQNPVGSGLSWVVDVDYQNQISKWVDSYRDGVYSVVAIGDLSAEVASDQPTLHIVSKSKNRQPYFADTDTDPPSTFHYWDTGKGGASANKANLAGVCYAIDFGPTFKTPSEETNLNKRNLWESNSLWCASSFEGNEHFSRLRGGIPIFKQVNKKTYSGKGSITLNLSKDIFGDAVNCYMFLSTKEIMGDSKDDIMNNISNDKLCKFLDSSGAYSDRFIEVTFNATKDYKFEFDDALEKDAVLYLKFAWDTTTSDVYQSIKINTSPSLSLQTE